MADKPEPGKQYRLTGASDVASIMRGDSWAASEVREDGPSADDIMRARARVVVRAYQGGGDARNAFVVLADRMGGDLNAAEAIVKAEAVGLGEDAEAVMLAVLTG